MSEAEKYYRVTIPMKRVGSITEVLKHGEYDQGDWVAIPYDDLYDLVHPRADNTVKPA